MAVGLLVSHFTTNYEEIKRNNKTLKKDLTWGTYRNSKLFLSELMKTLELTPQEVYEKVYFLEFHPASLRRLKFAYLNTNRMEKLSIKKDHNIKCFFVSNTTELLLNQHKLRGASFKNLTSFILNTQRLSLFSNDTSINRLKPLKLSFEDNGFAIVYDIIPYIPKEKQNCYANSFNPFVTTKPIRDLLIQAKSIKRGQLYKKISLNEKYDQYDQLISFNGKYIIKDDELGIPISLSLSINKKVKTYRLVVEIKPYFYWGQRNFNIKYFKINILNVDPKFGQLGIKNIVRKREDSDKTYINIIIP